ncbi:MAG TPA: MmgE/PrpD family protein [Acidimicrobiia bacterium]|nr:MmgE/PrpD family protein [Acidimicrobiia bacterium]
MTGVTQGPTMVQGLAAFAVACRQDGIPAAVERSVRQRIADTLGVSIAAQDLDTSRAAVAHILEQGGREEARVIGQDVRVPAAQAAFANGVLAHSLDYDDTHLPSVLHPSASIVPAALAVAEKTGCDGSVLAGGIAAGLEICVRLGMAGFDPVARNSVFFEFGQHATSICGAIGAAAAAAVILDLDESGVAHAMGIAVSFAGGVIEGNRTGGTVKRTHCGWAAHGGVTAAQLAARGFTGPPTALEGRFGFFEAFLKGRYDGSWLTDGLGQDWEVPGIFFKPYPANHFTHAGVDAAITMRKAGLRTEDIESVELGIASHTVRSIGEPLAVKQRPATGYQGQFSGPYTVVAALLGGGGLGLGLEDFDDALVTDPVRQELMAKVTVVADPICDEIFPYQFPAILRVRTKDGSLLEEQVLTSRGGPKRPLSDDELRQKMEDNSRPFVTPAGLGRLRRILTGPEAIDDSVALMEATVR